MLYSFLSEALQPVPPPKSQLHAREDTPNASAKQYFLQYSRVLFFKFTKFKIASQAVALITCIADTKIIETVKVKIASQAVALITCLPAAKMIETVKFKIASQAVALIPCIDDAKIIEREKLKIASQAVALITCKN